MLSTVCAVGVIPDAYLTIFVEELAEVFVSEETNDPELLVSIAAICEIVTAPVSVTFARFEFGVPKVALAPLICTALNVATLLSAVPETVFDAVNPFALVETVMVEL